MTKGDRRYILIAIVILLLGAFLRFHQIEIQSFWNDEGNSARLSERSISLIIEGTASDVHPPLYYLLLNIWRKFVGETEFGLRSFSAYLGIATIALTYALGRRLSGYSLAAVPLWGAFLVSVSPALIYYSQEARMYELLAFLTVASTLLLLRYLQANKGYLKLASTYILFTLAGLYTHYFYPAVIAGQILIAFLFTYEQLESTGKAILNRTDQTKSGQNFQESAAAKTGQSIRNLIWKAGSKLIIIYGLIFLLYLPWFPIFLRQTGGRLAQSPNIVDFLLDAIKWTIVGPTLSIDAGLIPVIVTGFLFIAGIVAGWLSERVSKLLIMSILSLAIIPILFMWLSGATRPAYFKFLVVVIPPLNLLAGVALWWGWKQGRGIIKTSGSLLLGSAITITMLWGVGNSLSNMYADPAYFRADYRGIADRISSDQDDDIGVVLNAANQWEVFTYYYDSTSNVYPIPRGYPDPVKIEEELEDVISKHNRIAALFWGEAERDPNRLVERWLDTHAYKTSEEWVGDVRLVTYSSSEGDPLEINRNTSVSFGDTIHLEGYSMSRSPLTSGSILQIDLYWRTDSLLSQRYKVFIHLVDPGGHLISQRDSEPGGGLELTTTWQVGQVYTDRHGLLI